MLQVGEGGDDVLRIDGYLLMPQNGVQLQLSFEFADGTVLDQAQFFALRPIVGTAGDDRLAAALGGTLPGSRLEGLAGNDELTGASWIDGGDGDDRIRGSAGNDTLSGGAGQDLIGGEDGDDEILWGLGSGADIVQDWWTGMTTLRVGPGLLPADVVVGQVEGASLLVRTRDGADRVLLQDCFAAAQDAANVRIVFDDGTVWTGATLLSRLSGSATPDADVLTGTDGGDVIAGLAGNDDLAGGSGNDTLTGGAGDDRLNGGYGNDTFVFSRGDGRDTLGDLGSGGTSDADRLQLRGFARQELTFDRYTDGTLAIRSLVSGDRVTLAGYFASDHGAGSANTTIELYADAAATSPYVTLNRSNLAGLVPQALPGTVGNDLLQGTAGSDHLQGGDGDDRLVDVESGGEDWLDGEAGRDTLDGGAGRDHLRGGAGNDIYLLHPDGGVDEVIDSGSNTIGLGAGFVLSDLQAERTGSDLRLRLRGTDSALVLRGYFSDPQAWAIVSGDAVLGSLQDVLADSQARRLDARQDLRDEFMAAIARMDWTRDTQAGAQIRRTGLGSWQTEYLGSQGLYGQYEVRDSYARPIPVIGYEGALPSGWSQQAEWQLTSPTVEQLPGLHSRSRSYAIGQTTVESGDYNNPEFSPFTADGSSSHTEAALRLHVDYRFSGESAGGSQSGHWAYDAAGRSFWVEEFSYTHRTTWEASTRLLQPGEVAVAPAAGEPTPAYVLADRWDDQYTYTVESVSAGAGSNTLVTAGMAEAGDGDDYVDAGLAAGGSGNDTLVGHLLSGGAGDDQLYGGGRLVLGTSDALADYLDGGEGADTMAGGDGDDTYVVDNAGDAVSESAGAGGGYDTVYAGVSHTLATNVEELILTGSAAINATGNAVNNALTGNSAANTLDGRGGADWMSGSGGDDTYVVERAEDVVVEYAGEGIDTVRSSVTYGLAAQVENLVLTGSAAINATGNALDNVLTGNSAANALAGEAGNDTYVVGTGDTVIELAGEGTDTVQSGVTWTLANEVENLTLTGSSAINATGNALDNLLTGNAGNNVLTGRAGNDTYVITAGDTVTELDGEGVDTVRSAATYTLGNYLENLTLTGSSAINGTGNTLGNMLQGNSANNTLSGLGGNDTYDGGAGTDALTDTSTSADIYRFGIGYGTDTITDAGGTDRVELGAGITQSQLVFKRNGNNLELTISGQTDKLIVANWYTVTANRIEEFRLADGSVVSPGLIPAAVQASAASMAVVDEEAGPQAIAEGWFQHWQHGWMDAWAVPGGVAPVSPPAWTAPASHVSLDQQVQALVNAMAAFGVPAGSVEPSLPVAHAQWPQWTVAVI